MALFQLDTIWHARGALEMVVTNLGDTAVADPKIHYGSITRTQLPPQTEGATLVHRQANYHEYASPKGTVVEPGQQWRFVENSLTGTAKHSNDGPKSAAIILSDGHCVETFVTDLQAAGAPPPGVSGNFELGLVPFPATSSIETYWAQAPAQLLVEGDPNLQRAANVVARLTRRLFPLCPVPFVFASADRAVRLAAQPGDLEVDAYEIRFDGKRIEITHGTGHGLLYALITLAQLLVHARTATDDFGFSHKGVITDHPRYEWRGAHLDVARQFHDLRTVHRYLDIMAWHKMNRFHWHLTDDEGWRLEIKALPKLTGVTSKTGRDMPILPQLGARSSGVGGYYSHQDIAFTIAHASELGIAVMPEIDLPGHCACVLGAYPEISDPDEQPESYHSVQGYPNNALNPGVEAAFKIATMILDEVCDLFPFHVVHVGGDEVSDNAWMQSPKAKALMDDLGLSGTCELQAHFMTRIQKFLAARGKSIGGWEELANGGGIDAKDCLLFGWSTVEQTASLANTGYSVISTPGQAYYLDIAQSDDWYEPGAAWAGTVPVEHSYDYEANTGSDDLDERLKGVQCCLWSEHLINIDRMNHQAYPRLSAVAEAGWTLQENKEFDRFRGLYQLMPRL